MTKSQIDLSSSIKELTLQSKVLANEMSILNISLLKRFNTYPRFILL